MSENDYDVIINNPIDENNFEKIFISLQNQLQLFEESNNLKLKLYLANINSYKKDNDINVSKLKELSEYTIQLKEYIEENKIVLKKLKTQFDDLLHSDFIFKSKTEEKVSILSKNIDENVSKLNQYLTIVKDIDSHYNKFLHEATTHIQSQDIKISELNQVFISKLNLLNEEIVSNKNYIEKIFNERIVNVEQIVNNNNELVEQISAQTKSDITEIQKQIQENVTKTEQKQYEELLELHLSNLFENITDNQTELLELKESVKTINNKILKKLNVLNENDTIKAELLDALKTSFNFNFEELNDRLYQLEKTSSENTLKEAKNNSNKIELDNIVNIVTEQLNFKLKQIKKEYNDKSDKTNAIVDSIKTRLKQLESNNNKIDYKKIDAIVKSYIRDKEFTPEHKFDGSYLYFKNPNGTWGHGIKVVTPSLGAGVVFDGTGGGAGNVSVYDESVLVNDKVTKFNFVGADVEVRQHDTDTNMVNIYIPPPNYSDFFNTGTATITPITTYNRRISNGVGGYFDIGDWIAGSIHPTIKNNILVFNTNTFYVFESIITSNLTINVKDAVGNIIAQNNVILSNNIDITVQNIRIINSNFAQEGLRYHIQSQIEIDLSNILLTGGRFSIEMIQSNNTIGNYSFIQNDIFYDKETNIASVGSNVLSENTPVIKYVSGIKYYTTGSTFNIALNNIDNINDESYVDNFIEIVSTELGINNFSLSSTDLLNYNTDYNHTGANYIGIKAIDINNICYSGGRKFSMRFLDWEYSNYFNSNSINMLINTLNANQTRIFEDFNNESERLNPISLTAWNSNLSLLSIEGGQNLIQRCSYLKYPTENFTTYKPDGNLDYSAIAGECVYIRQFRANGTDYSNGMLTFTGFNINNTNFKTNNYIKIMISPNNGIDWFNLNLDYLGGYLNNNDGCLINFDQYNLDNATKQLNFTFGELRFSQTLLFKIILTGDYGIEIDSIALNWI